MKELFNELGYDLSEKQLNQFERYFELLVEWNEKINLTAITEKKEVYIKHFLDSLYAIKAIDFSNQSICDIGSGAGFPGIPLKIIYPNLDLTIVDALNKRIKFLDLICDELGIEANNVHARAEEYIKDKREYFDVVFARAVARLNILSELCIPFVKINGYFVALKGSNRDEIKDAGMAISKLGGTIEDVINYSLPFNMGERNIVKVRKKQKTKQKYPRNFGKIKKMPL
jgi:16S rRNA (guanine527-N7)-methyltransferase